MMNTGGRVAVAVAAGYLLGRRKRLKLAIAVGSMMAGKRIATNPRGLARQANELVQSNDQLSQLSGEVRDKLGSAARAAAISVASSRMDAVSDSLRNRSESWGMKPLAESPSDDQQDDETEEPDSDDSAAKSEGSTTKKSGTSGTKKSAAKKGAAKKSGTKKSGTTKSASKNTSTGKTSSKRTASKTSAAGKSRTSRSTQTKSGRRSTRSGARS